MESRGRRLRSALAAARLGLCRADLRHGDRLALLPCAALGSARQPAGAGAARVALLRDGDGLRGEHAAAASCRRGAAPLASRAPAKGCQLAPVVATVAVERLFDMATLLFFFGVATLTLPLPPEWRRYGWVFLGTFVVFLGVLVLLLRFPARTVGALDKVLTPLPGRCPGRSCEPSISSPTGSAPEKRGRHRARRSSTRSRSGSRSAVTFGLGLSALDLAGSPDPRCALADDDRRHRGRRSRWAGIHRHVPGGLRGGAGALRVGKSLAFSYSVLVHVLQFAQHRLAWSILLPRGKPHAERAPRRGVDRDGQRIG